MKLRGTDMLNTTIKYEDITLVCVTAQFECG